MLSDLNFIVTPKRHGQHTFPSHSTLFSLRGQIGVQYLHTAADSHTKLPQHEKEIRKQQCFFHLNIFYCL